MTAPTYDQLAEKLSEGLDLCVRARKLDEAVTLAVAVGDRTADGGTKCLTPALWVQDAYDRDLATWEASATTMLSRLPQFSVSGRDHEERIADGSEQRSDLPSPPSVEEE